MIASRMRAAWVPLLNKPNHVLEKQKIYQDRFNHHVPTHLIPPRSKLYYNSYLVLFSLGMVGTAWSAYELVKGKQTTAD